MKSSINQIGRKVLYFLSIAISASLVAAISDKNFFTSVNNFLVRLLNFNRISAENVINLNNLNIQINHFDAEASSIIFVVAISILIGFIYLVLRNLVIQTTFYLVTLSVTLMTFVVLVSSDRLWPFIQIVLLSSVISNAVSFLIVGGLLLISNFSLFQAALPILVGVFVFGFTLGSILLIAFRTDTKHVGAEYQAFSVIPALKFVSVIIILSLLVQVLELAQVNTSFVIFITALSGITGIDAPSIAIAGLVTSGVITVDVGLTTFLLTVFFNLVAKGFYSYTIGTRKYAKYLMIGLMINALVGLLIYIL